MGLRHDCGIDKINAKHPRLPENKTALCDTFPYEIGEGGGWGPGKSRSVPPTAQLQKLVGVINNPGQERG